MARKGGGVLRFGTTKEYKGWLANRNHIVDPIKEPVAKQDGEPRRTKTLILRIPIRSASLNEIYSAEHWAVRAKLARQVQEQVTWQLKIDGIEQVPFAPRVDIHVDAYFYGKLLDSSNVPVKLYEDGLVSYGVLENDDPRFVRRVSSESHMSDTGREWVVITIKHVKDKDTA